MAAPIAGRVARRAGVGLAGTIIALAVPCAVMLTTVRLLVFDTALYERGYQRYGVRHTTGMTDEQLALATEQIQAYFRGGPPVSLIVEKEWGREALFNAREQRHLEDVRALLERAWAAQSLSLGMLLATAAGAALLGGRHGLRWFAGVLAVGAALTVALFALLGALIALDFRGVWTLFHQLSFANDLWLLDPQTDYMIRMYPLGFWFDAVTEFAVRTVATSLALLSVALVVRRLLPAAPRPRDV